MAQCYIRRRRSDELKIVTWAGGTDLEIARMIAAADAGQIVLSDYWHVGDERTVRIGYIGESDAFPTSQAAQDVVWVLMNVGYTGTGNEHVNFVVGQKNCLSGTGRVNATNVTGNWGSSAMRTALNSDYYAAVPTVLRACLKQFKTYSATAYNAQTVSATDDYVSLFADKEVTGNGNTGTAAEQSALSQMSYYSTAANRKKDRAYRLRSISRSSASMYVQVSTAGAAANSQQTQLVGVAPFVCI